MPNIKSMNESQLAEKLKDNYDLVRTQAIKDIENLEEISSSIMDKLYELMRKDPFQTVRIAAAKVILLKSSNVEEINIVQNVLSNIKESEFYKENSVVCEALDNMVLTCKSLLLKQIKENEIKLSSDNIPQIPGLEFVPIPGDGHCLFNAVGIYLQEPQDYLRKQVALYFSANKERYRDSVVLGTGTVEDYISRIYSGEEWGTHVEIEILMQIYRRPIIVIESRGVTNPDAINRFPGKPVFVYYNGYDHYNGLIMRQENGEQILNNLLQQDEKGKLPAKK
ncbi:MAG: hypothetical protein HWD59_00125 [Coxiellaceae bacterium]|nr:MAG: hypothetical protein HWD59_00125 [Coxiellaceae bacterium]